jgi:hypothetical protein
VWHKLVPLTQCYAEHIRCHADSNPNRLFSVNASQSVCKVVPLYVRYGKVCASLCLMCGPGCAEFWKVKALWVTRLSVWVQFVCKPIPNPFKACRVIRLESASRPTDRPYLTLLSSDTLPFRAHLGILFLFPAYSVLTPVLSVT